VWPGKVTAYPVLARGVLAEASADQDPRPVEVVEEVVRSPGPVRSFADGRLQYGSYRPGGQVASGYRMVVRG
jgi:hypothetical protein